MIFNLREKILIMLRSRECFQIDRTITIRMSNFRRQSMASISVACVVVFYVSNMWWCELQTIIVVVNVVVVVTCDWCRSLWINIIVDCANVMMIFKSVVAVDACHSIVHFCSFKSEALTSRIMEFAWKSKIATHC